GPIEAGTDGKNRSKNLAKILTVRLEAGKIYQIDHKSRAFDAYLYLEGPDGAVLARDDDGGGNLNARIVHRAAETGTYRIIATSVSGTGSGAFSVSVRVLGGSSGAMNKGPDPLPGAVFPGQTEAQKLRPLLQRILSGNKR